MQDQGDVQRAFGGLGRPVAGQHVKEVTSVGEIAIRLDQRQAFANAIVVSHDHRYLGCQPNRLTNVAPVVVALLFGVKPCKRGHNSAQHVHGKGVARCLPQQADNASVEFAFTPKADGEILQFLAVGHSSKPEQVADFIEV